MFEKKKIKAGEGLNVEAKLALEEMEQETLISSLMSSFRLES